MIQDKSVEVFCSVSGGAGQGQDLTQGVKTQQAPGLAVAADVHLIAALAPALEADHVGRRRAEVEAEAGFGAPACVYFTIDGGLNEQYACLDIGSIGTTLCFAALQEGLGTIYLAASMHYPDIVKRVLDIPESKKVVIGIAIGRAHPDAPASVFRSDREPTENILRFA